MAIAEIKTFEFVEQEVMEPAFVIIRAGEGMIGLALTVEKHGDFEVFMSSDDCKKLVKHLGEAIVATIDPHP